ncbi:MAG: vanadium-dependent haloperoxidase [Bryobacteraceae bacterium]
MLKGRSRRAFLGTATAAPAVILANGPTTPQTRAELAYQVRVEAARRQKEMPEVRHISNGDEQRYPTPFASFAKGLPHDRFGEAEPEAYQQLVRAMTTGEHAEFEAMPMGCGARKFVNPKAGLAYDMVGADSHHLTLPPAPRFEGAEAAGEMLELYWMALARDQPFAEYGSNSILRAACDELSAFNGFLGPRIEGKVTPQTLFRGITPADLQGPFVSQFLLKPINYGAQYVDQRIRTSRPRADYLTDFPGWLAAQNGCAAPPVNYDPTPRYVRNGRDLAEWVHRDVVFQAYFNASLILLNQPDPDAAATRSGIAAPLAASNPYLASRNQDGFGTFGPPFIQAMVAEVAVRALKTVWHQKWYVHRRLRPEEFGGRVNAVMNGTAGYPIFGDLVRTEALQRVYANHGSYLLPQAYPEGCPLHPAYGAGHATVAGACTTILKACFDESYEIPEPVEASTDGISLHPYAGQARLTVGGELNKLAANIAMARNFAGIHWRTDYSRSVELGEAVAMRLLQDVRMTVQEGFEGFEFTSFRGQKITV